MITLGNDKNLMETIRRMSITPVTVSYEYEPCDKLKARELALSENAVYHKQPGEDFNSIKQGIFGQKGRLLGATWTYFDFSFLSNLVLVITLLLPAVFFG